MSRRLLLAGLVALALAAGLVAAGRVEGGHAADAQLDGIDRVWRDVGQRLDTPQLAGYRRAYWFDCLVYRRAASTFARELCFDRQGRLVEAIDRSAGFHASSIRFEPGLARVRVDRVRLDGLLRRLGADAPGAPVGPAIASRRQR